MKPHLIHLSELTQKWLVYAEAKNTAIIVGNTFALFKLIGAEGSLTTNHLLLLVALLLFFATSIAFLAVLPLDNYLDLKDQSIKDCRLNPFSSKNLPHHTPQSLFDTLGIEMDEKADIHMAAYIIGTAKLIYRKFRYFKIASALTVMGIALLGIHLFV